VPVTPEDTGDSGIQSLRLLAESTKLSDICLSFSLSLSPNY
jgi:hypothetical protein